jgi:hypothetical protein
MTKKNIPFSFVFEYLLPLVPAVKPMFGLWAIYVHEKIVLILRQRPDLPGTNGVWIATSSEHHASLKIDLPAICSIAGYSSVIKESEWQMIAENIDDFETSVRKVCELIVQGDERIGRWPKPGSHS